MTAANRILLAEDDPVIAMVISDQLAGEGMTVDCCDNGQAAWQRLQDGPGVYDAVLLDRRMPGMDGIDLLRRIKAEPRLAALPVVMQTASGDEQSILEGLTAGAYYYLTKPVQPDVLLAVVKAALEQSLEQRQMLESVRRAERPLALLQNGCFRFRELEEGRLLANYLARACPDPERVVQGLQELLINAVEHGNLGISYAEKTLLLRDGTWQDEILRRLHLPAYRDRYVEVSYQRRPGALCFRIQDQGEGFDWSQYLDFSPERAFDLHGRGIAMARQLSFDQLNYEGNGNTVWASVALEVPTPAAAPVIA